MIIYHLQKEKLPPVFEPFWNSFHFSIKCALLPARGRTIKKVLNTATPWGGSFYLKISLICPYWFYALAFLSVFSFFCRRSGGDASSDTRPLAPPRPPYVWLRTKTNHQVNTPQRSWNFRLTRIMPDHVSKSSFFWVYFIISHQSKLFPLKWIWDVQISLTLLTKNNFNGDQMLVRKGLPKTDSKLEIYPFSSENFHKPPSAWDPKTIYSWLRPRYHFGIRSGMLYKFRRN